MTPTHFWLWRCDRCPYVGRLFAVVGGRLLCAACWRDEGQPFPTERLSAMERAIREQEIVNRMARQKRGHDRYMAISGKA